MTRCSVKSQNSVVVVLQKVLTNAYKDVYINYKETIIDFNNLKGFPITTVVNLPTVLSP